MKIERSYVTPLTAGAFLLTAATGTLMFFHLDSGLNKVAHEWLSLLLLGGGALHVAANWAAFARHLKQLRGQILIGVFALILAASFYSPAVQSRGGGNQGQVLITALSRAPISALAAVAGVPASEMRNRLAGAGVKSTDDTQSLSGLIGDDRRRQMQVLALVLAAQ